MTEQKQLRELQNNIRIVGTLKSVDLEIKPNKKDPTVKQIMGSITVITVDKVNNRVNEHELNLFAKESSKLYKGYLTIKNEYKPADSVGTENADRVQVTGSVNENIYKGNDETLKSFNRLRGLFVNRIEEGDLAKQPSLAEDSAIAQIEIVSQGIEPITDKDGIETGEYRIKGFNVGYNNGVSNIKDMIIGEDLIDIIQENYSDEATGLLTFAINNYVELEEKKEDPFAEAQGGFGVQVDISNGPIKHYTRELRVIGGFPPYFDERALSEEDIQFAKQIHALKVQEAMNTQQSQQPQTGGFGNANGFSRQQNDPFAANAGMKIDIKEDDLPF